MSADTQEASGSIEPSLPQEKSIFSRLRRRALGKQGLSGKGSSQEKSEVGYSARESTFSSVGGLEFHVRQLMIDTPMVFPVESVVKAEARTGSIVIVSEPSQRYEGITRHVLVKLDPENSKPSYTLVGTGHGGPDSATESLRQPKQLPGVQDAFLNFKYEETGQDVIMSPGAVVSYVSCVDEQADSPRDARDVLLAQVLDKFGVDKSSFPNNPDTTSVLK